MQIANSSNSGQVNDFQSQGANSQGRGNLLTQLEDRVSQALAKQNSAVGEKSELSMSPEQVVQTIAGMTGQAVPGMNHSFVI